MRALPRQTPGTEIDDLAVDAQNRLEQRCGIAAHEVCVARKLDGRPCATMQDAERVYGAIGRMNARERQPVIARDLPRDFRRGNAADD